jgi:thiamine pyrophosphokinase
MTHVVVVIGGGDLTGRARRAAGELDDGALIVAADGGLDHAVEAGLAPSVLVGDLDSITAAGTMWAYAHEVEIERHPDDKDATDTELALARAAASGCTDLLVLGGAGDRLDHTLGTLVALGAPPLGGFRTVRAMLGDSEVHTVHAGRVASLALTVGTVFSLLPLHGACRGVTVTGARWPLDGADLPAGASLGVSNEAIDTVRISVGQGVLTVVLP